METCSEDSITTNWTALVLHEYDEVHGSSLQSAGVSPFLWFFHSNPQNIYMTATEKMKVKLNQTTGSLQPNKNNGKLWTFIDGSITDLTQHNYV